jgi:hypothetical protein
MNAMQNKYLNRIRNNDKQDYALDYLAWVLQPVGEPPDRLNYGALSFSAAQAIRMEVRELTAKDVRS